MTDNPKGGATIVVDDAHMVPNPDLHELIPGKSTDISDDPKNIPHNMDRDVTTSALQKELVCPQCGKPTLRVEFPDQYEAWMKCSSCSFFMGMGEADWHRMENSPNINEKIRKTAIKKGLKVLA